MIVQRTWPKIDIEFRIVPVRFMLSIKRVPLVFLKGSSFDPATAILREVKVKDGAGEMLAQLRQHEFTIRYEDDVFASVEFDLEIENYKELHKSVYGANNTSQ